MQELLAKNKAFQRDDELQGENVCVLVGWGDAICYLHVKTHCNNLKKESASALEYIGCTCDLMFDIEK